jgi:hypothetical protein
MAQASPGSQAGGTQSAHQPMVVLFERDESLAGMLLGQLRSLGYECRPARIPVEVFDFIARYPVGLVLINLGHAATSRRDFWVALENKQRERGVQYLTYRYLIPGMKRDTENLLHSQVDVEMAGPQSIFVLVEKVKAVLPPPARPTSGPDHQFTQPPAVSAGAAAPASFAASAEAAARPAIAGVLNLSNGSQPGKQAEFAPLLAPQNGATNGPSSAPWLSEALPVPEMPGASFQHKPAPRDAAQLASQGGPGSANNGASQGGPGSANNGTSSTSRTLENGMRGSNGSAYAGGSIVTPLLPTMPVGDLANLTAAINALAAAGVPGYQQAAAAVQALDQANTSNSGEAARRRDSGGMAQESQPLYVQGTAGANGYNGQAAQSAGMAPPPTGQSRTYPGAPSVNSNGRQDYDPRYASYQPPTETRPPQEPGRTQDSRSRALGGNPDDYEQYQREQAARMGGRPDESSGGAWRPSGSVAPTSYSSPYQHQMLAPVAVPGQVERSLSNVLVEGQLISPQRLEVALGIQRLLRGADIDYRLGELLLMFKFLTPDQLLAALLVSRGMVTPAQVAAMGRIKQELHNIGMEYDLENLLILFRLLGSEQLREIRSEIP